MSNGYPTPLDEIALVIVAQMYHIHISIIMHSYYWTIRRDHDLKQCCFVLGFTGKLTFVDTKQKGLDLDLPYNFRKSRCPPPEIVEPKSPKALLLSPEPVVPVASRGYQLHSKGPSTPTKTWAFIWALYTKGWTSKGRWSTQYKAESHWLCQVCYKRN